MLSLQHDRKQFAAVVTSVATIRSQWLLLKTSGCRDKSCNCCDNTL